MRSVVTGVLFPLAALVILACSGGGQKIAVAPSAVACGPLDDLGRYRYNTKVTLEVPASDDPAIANVPYAPFKLTLDIDGKVQGKERTEVLIHYPDTMDPDYPIIVVNGVVYEYIAGWTPSPVDPNVAAIPYPPLRLCQSLETSAVLQGLDSTPEAVNGIAAQKYELTLPPGFAAGVWGPASDMASDIPQFDATVWLADDGGWPVRADIHGLGHFDNGRELRADVFWEIRDINDESIKVEPPIPAPN